MMNRLFHCQPTKKKTIQILRLCIFCGFLVSCRPANEKLGPAEYAKVRDSVTRLANSISTDISMHGPLAWLNYFENSTGFFMISDGKLVFPNYDSAKNFITQTLVQSITRISLKWSAIRIEPLSAKLAGLSAAFHEDITDRTGTIHSVDGYFSAIVQQNDKGWQLKNAHWSISKPG